MRDKTVTLAEYHRKWGVYMAEMLPYIWIGIAVLLGIVEISTTQLVSIWFVIAAIVTAVSSATFLYDCLLWQIVLFVAVSGICLIATRPLVKKIKSNKGTRTNADKYIGRVGKVISDIGYNTYTGQVEVDGSKWTAVSADNSVIVAGTTIKVLEIKGVKLIVTPVEN